MKNKKVIFVFLILFIVFFGTLFLILNLNKSDLKIDDTEYKNLENSSMFNDAIIVDKTTTDIKNINNYIVEEISNIHEIIIEDIKINVDLSKHNMISYSNFKLNNNYYLTEILISKKGNLQYLNDAQLSTTYNSSENYSKIWFLYNMNESYLYKAVDLTGENNLILNTNITENSLEFDVMSSSPRGTTAANHYKISISEFLNKVTNGETFDYYNYSVYMQQDLILKDSNLKSSQELILDLNGDVQEEKILVEIYDEGEDYYYSGYKLSINNKEIQGQIDWPNKKIGIIDLDDKTKGIIITNYENEIQDHITIIYTYNNNEIVEAFRSTKFYEIFMFENSEGFKNININKKDGQLLLDTEVQDNIQNWDLTMKYFLNNDKVLQLVSEDYYLNKVPVESTTTQNVYLYKSRDFYSEKVLIPTNSKVLFIGTDLNYWGIVEYEDNIYYLAINTDGTIKDLNVEAAGVFDGIHAAD